MQMLPDKKCSSLHGLEDHVTSDNVSLKSKAFPFISLACSKYLMFASRSYR